MGPHSDAGGIRSCEVFVAGKNGRCKVSAVGFISPEDMKRWDMEAATRKDCKR